MQTKLVGLIILMASISAIADEKSLICTDPTGQVRIEIDTTNQEAQAEILGLAKANPDLSLRPPGVNASIGVGPKTLKAKASQSGNRIQIEASGLDSEFCSGCANGIKYKIRQATAKVTTDLVDYYFKHLTCELMTFE